MTPPLDESAAQPSSLSRRVGVGDIAPPFTLRDQHGHEVSLAALRGRPVVVYFYPRDDSPICTSQACGFRDAMADFAALNAIILGISSDSVESHAAFARRFNITFSLLADTDSAVRRLYGVPKTFLVFPGRTTYVIDADGVVRHVFSSQMQAAQHIAQARQALERLRQP